MKRFAITRRDALKLGAAGIAGTGMMGRAAAQTPEASITQSVDATPPRADAPIVVKWRYATGVSWNESPVATGNLVIGTGGDGFAYALDATNGEELWRTPLSGDPRPPMAIGDIVLISEYQGGLVALDKATGEERWRTSPTDIIDLEVAESAGLAIYCDPHGAIIGVEIATGTEAWRFETHQQYVSLGTTMLLVNNEILHAKTGESDLFALDLLSGAERWRHSGKWPHYGELVLANDNLYTIKTDGLYALNQENGESVWQLPIDATSNSTSELRDDTIYFSVMEGPVYAVDVETGRLVWQAETQSYGAGKLQITDSMIVMVMTIGGLSFPQYQVHGLDRGSGATVWQGWYENYNQLSLCKAEGDTVYIGENHSRMPEAAHNLHLINARTGEPFWTWQDMGGFSRPPTFANGNAYFGKTAGTVVAIGNLPQSALSQDVVLRGAPSTTSIERGTAAAGTKIDVTGAQRQELDGVWVEVTIDGVQGWIPLDTLDTIDPATLPPEGEIEYVYVP